jgi:hypothetical protein
MLIVRWIRKILPFLNFLNIRKRYQRRSSLIKIEVAKAYVLGVKKIRFFLLGVLFVLFSLVLFVSGLLLIYTALFAYSGWTVQVKFMVALLLGVFEVLLLAVFCFICLEKKLGLSFRESTTYLIQS